MRYNAACITTSGTDTGTRFEDVPNVCVVYISKFDIFNEGKTIYHLDNVIRETGTVIDDGQQEIFVNTQVVDGTDISELMQCFLKNKMEYNNKYPKMFHRFNELKETEGGRNTMCELMEEYAREAVEKAREEGREEAKQVREEAREAIERARREGLKALVITLKMFFDDFEKAYEAVISNPTYADASREEVMECWQEA